MKDKKWIGTFAAVFLVAAVALAGWQFALPGAAQGISVSEYLLPEYKIVKPVMPRFCPKGLPDPEVTLVGTETYVVGGKKFVRYFLSVDNRYEYPDYLFLPAPSLPPCGLNPNASRTWVQIYDQDAKYVYGFCALSAAENLGSLWFAVEAGKTPPDSVTVIFWDRWCKVKYTSDPVPIAEGLVGTPPSEDIHVKSKWDATSPVINGNASGTEWAEAGRLDLLDNLGVRRGFLYVKNDSEFLYILLAMTMDDQAGPNADDDMSGIAFDIQMDGVKTPYEDLKYGTASGSEVLGIQYSTGGPGWSTVAPTALSSYAEGFGPTIAANNNHKFYEYKLSYDEIGIDFESVLADPSKLFHARMNVMVRSLAPPFSLYYPSSYAGSWGSPMILVSLDLGPDPVYAGCPIIKGIGLVPRTFIDPVTGLATTGPDDAFPNLKDAPFGGHLRVKGCMDELRARGIEYYAIAYWNNDIVYHLEVVDDVRTNYYWDTVQRKYIRDNVTPQHVSLGSLELQLYPVPDGALDWYFPDLLFDWRTTSTPAVNSGKYTMVLLGFKKIGPTNYQYVPTHLSESLLVVQIDNTHPVMRINSISHMGAEVGPCGFVRLESSTDTLVVNVSAYDIDQHLRNFSLQGLYGDNQSFTCYAENYNDYLGGGGTRPDWVGYYPDADFVCRGDANNDHWETTCAYDFWLHGWDRAINGYGHIHHKGWHRTITVLMPEFELP